MASIEPQIFATAVTGGVALLSFVGQSMSTRRVDARARRTIADASSLVAFYRDWHTTVVELRERSDSPETAEVLRKLAAAEQDVTKMWERSRQKEEGNSILRWLKIPAVPLTTGGRMLHVCYYVSIFAIVRIMVAMAIGVSDPNETTEGRFAGILGAILIVMIFSGFAWLFRRLANSVDTRARAALSTVS